MSKKQQKLSFFQNIRRYLCGRRNKKAIVSPYIHKKNLFQISPILKVSKFIESDSETQSEDDRARNINKSDNKGKQRYARTLYQPQIKCNTKKEHVNPILALSSSHQIISQIYTQKSINSQFFEDFQELIISKQLSIDAIIQAYKQSLKTNNQLFEQNNKMQQYFWKSLYVYSNQPLNKDDSQILQKCQRYDQTQSNLINWQYQIDIHEVRQFKYQQQLAYYPLIELDDYQNIKKLWYDANKKKNQIIMVMNLKMLQKLTYRSFKTLSYGNWLNDQIINGYLEMLQKQVNSRNVEIYNNRNNSFNKLDEEIMKDLERPKKPQQFKILNSFFAITIFSKSAQMITRALKRKNITVEDKIIIAINNGNHWWFVYIYNGQVTMYDSMRKQYSQEYKLKSQYSCEILNNIRNFAQIFYQRQPKLSIASDFPQQDNGYDCGMFLLCGIKDIVLGRNEPQWSFSQDDMVFKRIHVAYELLTQSIHSQQKGSC